MRRILLTSSCAAVLGLGWVAAQDAARPEAPAAPPPVRESDEAQQPGSAEPQRPDDLQAIRGLVGKFAETYNAGDATGLAALFAEDAEVVADDGSVVEGREAIAERFATTFENNPDTTITIEPESVRFLADDSAMERGTATLKSADGSAFETSPYSVIYVKRDGRWLHAVVRDEPGGEPSHHERLAELEWMVGEWINESDDAVVSISCRWDDAGNFLVRDFDVRIEGQVALRGTQRIGWDPLQKQPRVWVFDDQGGFAEGLMARSGDQWIIKANGVRSDGQPASATSIVTRLGEDRVGWQVVDRTIGGEAVPEIDEFIMVRKPPEPAD